MRQSAGSLKPPSKGLREAVYGSSECSKTRCQKIKTARHATATLSSRVTFSVNGRDPDTRVISHDRMTSPIGMFLPITIARGLALLGLAEGQQFLLTNEDGVEERILLEKVRYQPEAAKREKEAMAGLPTSVQRKPALKLIRGAFYDQPRLVPRLVAR